MRRCVSFHSLRRSATIEPQGRICGERCTASTRLRGACCDAQVGAWHATLGTTKAEGALSARLVLGHSWEGSRACGRVLNTATRRKTMRHDRCHSHYGNATRSTHSATARLTCHGFPTLLQLRVQPHTVTLFVKGTSTHTARCARCATAPTNHHFSLLPTLLVPGGNATVNVLLFFPSAVLFRTAAYGDITGAGCVGFSPRRAELPARRTLCMGEGLEIPFTLEHPEPIEGRR